MTKTSKPKLLPCPFCGGKAEYDKRGEFCGVYCSECCIHTTKWLRVDKEYDVKKHLAEFWNRRVANDKNTELKGK